MTYAARLKDAMAHASVDNRKLAKHLDVSRQAIDQALAGKTASLSALNSALAAKFLGVSTHWLATGEGEMLASEAKESDMLTNEERDVLIAMRVLPAQERAEVKSLIVDKARAQLAQLESLIGRQAPQDNIHQLPVRR